MGGLGAPKALGLVTLTVMQVMDHLRDLSKELDDLVKKIGEEDHIATVQKEEYLRAYAKAWRAAQGSVEARKQIAIALTAEQRMAAEVADCEVRNLRRQIEALKLRIEVGRSLGSAIKAEVSLSNSSFSPFGA